MEDRQIIELYWQRLEQAVTETADKYGKPYRQNGRSISLLIWPRLQGIFRSIVWTGGMQKNAAP